AGRLLCPETKAFRIFLQHVGNIIAIPWRPAHYRYRHCWQFLRPFYRERCLYARLRTSGPLRLRCFEHREREQGGFAVDETLSQSRYPSFSAHFFWETRADLIISVEPGFYLSVWQIGRASCRERVENNVGNVVLKGKIGYI